MIHAAFWSGEREKKASPQSTIYIVYASYIAKTEQMRSFVFMDEPTSQCRTIFKIFCDIEEC